MITLVPIPPDDVWQSAPVWTHYLDIIAREGGYDPQQLLMRIASGEVQPILAWDDEAKKPMAFAGLRLFQRGKDTIAEIIWLSGESKEQWVHLLTDLENYARHIGCAGMRMFARRGWKPFLVKSGYSETHVILDKDFANAR